MSDELIAALEYETLVFSRHQTGLPGRSRRSGGQLDQSAYTLLTIIRMGGPASISDLAAITGLDASTLNRQTAALLRDDYAERIPDPDGGIARKFQLTELGSATLEEERQASSNGMAQMIADWEPADRVTFLSLLRRLNLTIEGRLGRSWPRPDEPSTGGPA